MERTHFADFIGEKIYDLTYRHPVTLISLKKDVLTFVNGRKVEQEGTYDNFKIIVKNELEGIQRKLPLSTYYIINEFGEVREPTGITPEIFLRASRDFVNKKWEITDKEMNANCHDRHTRYMESRQVIMACYFSAFKHSKEIRMSLGIAGAIYNKDHSTVIHAIKTINNRLATEKYFYNEYHTIFDMVISVSKNKNILDILT